jgi:arylsulfatase A-like enzyme
MVSSLDVAATVLDQARVAPTLPLDGVPLVSFLKGERTHEPHDALFWRRDVVAAVREGDWKLVRVLEDDGSFRDPVLIDLANDPDEDTDVAARHPERVAHLLARLAAWESELEDPRWTEGDRWRMNQRRKHRMDVLGRDAERRFP